jgi:hypothetical protein
MPEIVKHAKLTITRSSHPEFDYFLDLRDADTSRQIAILHETEHRVPRIHKWLEDLAAAAAKVGSKLTVIDETGEIV